MDIINDILDLSKIEAGKLTVEHLECNPMQIVDEIVELMSIRSQSKGVDLRTDLQFPLPCAINSDPTRLRQILMNLVGNAIKFTEYGSITIQVKMTKGEKPYIVFNIIDTGIGLSKEQCAKLFKPFTRR